jgi:hypothetical protein
MLARDAVLKVMSVAVLVWARARDPAKVAGSLSNTNLPTSLLMSLVTNFSIRGRLLSTSSPGYARLYRSRRQACYPPTSSDKICFTKLYSAREYTPAAAGMNFSWYLAMRSCQVVTWMGSWWPGRRRKPGRRQPCVGLPFQPWLLWPP